MYDIYADTQVVGQAEVIKEGLYYCFSCRCTPPNDGVHRILVSDGNRTKDLGICVPTGEWFCLVSRVPIKQLTGEHLKFSLVPKGRVGSVISIADNAPFPAIDMLESARLQEGNGETEIVIVPIPDQQDNDQSQESPHK